MIRPKLTILGDDLAVENYRIVWDNLFEMLKKNKIVEVHEFGQIVGKASYGKHKLDIKIGDEEKTYQFHRKGVNRLFSGKVDVVFGQVVPV